MKNTLKLLFGLPLLLLMVACQPKEPGLAAPQLDMDSLAAANPDHYVWLKFCEFFANTDQTKHVVEWENWINEDDIYDPPCDSIRHWPTAPPKIHMKMPKTLSMLEGLRKAQGELDTTMFAFLTLNPNPYLEEVRINKPMFDYINDNKLYLKANVQRMAVAGEIDFPNNSAILKSQWKTIDPSEKAKYYWREYADDKGEKHLIGMAGFHLVTHELPNWVWSTFEHVDNPGRCDYIGCHDSFGFSPAVVNPNKLDSLVYTEPAEMTAELQKLFAEFKIDKVFKNYRLKACQIDYVDAQNQATLNGSSVLEANIVSTSSCISCHARATVNSIDSVPLSMFVDPNIIGSGTFELGKLPNTSRGWHPVCFTGTPDSADYHPANPGGPDSIFYRTNFMWQLAQDAGSCNGTDNGAGNFSAAGVNPGK